MSAIADIFVSQVGRRHSFT